MKIQSKRILSTVTLFSFLALLPMSCGLFCADTCGCGPVGKTQNLRIKSFNVLTVNESGNIVLEREVRPYNKVFKALKINEVEYKNQSSIESVESWPFGSAFACSPIPPMTENTLYLIQIINQKEFTLIDGSTFSPGENITALFGMNYSNFSELSTIENFIGSGRRLIKEDYFNIGLLENPGKELNLQFSIHLFFDDAQEFLFTDQILTIR